MIERPRPTVAKTIDHAEWCPHCGADLQGPPIPEDQRRYYGGATRFSRKVGIEEHDRVDHWRCPDCGREWR